MAIGEIRWFVDAGNELKIATMKSSSLSDGSLSTEQIGIIVDNAWCEFLSLIDADIDESVGLFQWQDIVNDEVPSKLVINMLGVEKVAVKHLAEWRNIPLPRLLYHHKKWITRRSGTLDINRLAD